MTYALNGWPFGWAFCPVDPTRFKRPLRDNALTSLAGPAVNFAVVLVCVGALWVPMLTPPGMFNRTVFYLVGKWNLILAVFNLMPLPGLDGYDVWRVFLPLSMRMPLDNFRKMGFLPLVLAIFVGSEIFGGFLMDPLIGAYRYLLPSGFRLS